MLKKRVNCKLKIIISFLFTIKSVLFNSKSTWVTLQKIFVKYDQVK